MKTKRYKHNITYWLSAIYYLILTVVFWYFADFSYNLIEYIVLLALLFAAGREIYWFYRDRNNESE